MTHQFLSLLAWTLLVTTLAAPARPLVASKARHRLTPG
jgi:hypothetical protein